MLANSAASVAIGSEAGSSCAMRWKMVQSFHCCVLALFWAANADCPCVVFVEPTERGPEASTNLLLYSREDTVGCSNV